MKYKALYADLIAAAQQESSPPEGAFTLPAFMRDSGMNEQTARRFLSGRVDAGALQTDMFTTDGNRRRFWWFVGGAQ